MCEATPKYTCARKFSGCLSDPFRAKFMITLSIIVYMGPFRLADRNQASSRLRQAFSVGYVPRRPHVPCGSL
jgi:hypothetical protein